MEVDLGPQIISDFSIRKKRTRRRLASAVRFSDILQERLIPAFSAKEIITHIIIAAIEASFGANFTSGKGFDKMVGTIVETIVTNSNFRRQALIVSSYYIEKKLKNGKTNF